eukprot:4464730-Pyramimonas_sp.AAC.1
MASKRPEQARPRRLANRVTHCTSQLSICLHTRVAYDAPASDVTHTFPDTIATWMVNHAISRLITP